MAAILVFSNLSSGLDMEWYTREVNCTTSDLRTKDLGKLALVPRYLNKTKGIGTSYASGH